MANPRQNPEPAQGASPIGATLRTAVVSPLERARTLYEQTMASDFSAPMEDDGYRYIVVRDDSDERLLQFFRLGYEPAEGHKANDGANVVLRMKKDLYQKRYDEACRSLRGLVKDQPKADSARGVTDSSVREAAPATMDDLLVRLPETPDEIEG